MTNAEQNALDECRNINLQGTDLIAYAIIRLAQETGNVAYQLRSLGNGDAASTMGAIEHLAVTLKDALSNLGESIISASTDPA